MLYAEGVEQHSPGSRVRERTLGCLEHRIDYPDGVTQLLDSSLWYPFGVPALFRQLTQGALADSRPWAGLCNPFGVNAFRVHALSRPDLELLKLHKLFFCGPTI